jgi:hypothetical protein
MFANRHRSLLRDSAYRPSKRISLSAGNKIESDRNCFANTSHSSLPCVFALLGWRDKWRSVTSFGLARKNGKAGPATGSGSDLNAVSQNSDRLSYDEEADTQTIAPRRIKPGKGFEHSRYPVPGNTDSGVIYVDTDALAGVAAT